MRFTITRAITLLDIAQPAAYAAISLRYAIDAAIMALLYTAREGVADTYRYATLLLRATLLLLQSARIEERVIRDIAIRDMIIVITLRYAITLLMPLQR